MTASHSGPGLPTRRATRVGWVSHLGVAAVALAVGYVAHRAPATEAPATEAPSTPVPDAEARVTGVGGIFFKSADPAALLAWYRAHLGIAAAEWGGFAFEWRDKDRPDETGYTVWSVFDTATGYFAPSREPFMVNFRVADIDGLVTTLRAAGVTIVGEIERHPNGAFAWILDPEGRKVELWEPVASAEDPYLR